MAAVQVFRSMLLQQELSSQSNPSVILWDTSMEQLHLILDFMYFGEIKVGRKFYPEVFRILICSKIVSGIRILRKKQI